MGVLKYDVIERLRLNARDAVYGFGALKITATSRHPKPLYLCNSYPKSGTHLLAQILLNFSRVKAWNDIISVQSLSGVMNSQRHLKWKLASAPQHSLVRSHLMFTPEVRDALARHRVKQFFVYRDLRDVAVSHANWVLKEPRIFLHNIYKELPSFDECLMASIEGIPLGSPFGSNISQPSIAADFARWRGWLTDPDTLAIRFEDLVGARGNSDESARLATVRKISDFLGESLSDYEIEKRFSSAAMNPMDSHTFRKGNKGTAGGWATRFKDNHKIAFKKVAGDLLVDLGYEKGLDW